jgi:CRISPR-associated protein Cmr5
MSRTFEQDRAKFALEAVTKIDKEKDKYETLIKQLPAMVLNNGLGQTMAYLLAKDGGEHKEPSWHLYSCLEKWIAGQGIFPAGDLIGSLMRSDRNKYMHAQHEILKLLTWMVKFADAYLKGPEAGEAKAEEQRESL